MTELELKMRPYQIIAELEQIDRKSIRAIRAGDTQRIAQLEVQAEALRAELKSLS